MEIPSRSKSSLARALIVFGLFLAINAGIHYGFRVGWGSKISALKCEAGCATLASAPGVVLSLAKRTYTLQDQNYRETSAYIGNFDLELELRAGPPNGQWRTVFLRGTDHLRFPYMALYPDQNRLHLRVSSKRGWNDGADSLFSIPENQWVKVSWKFRHDGKSLLEIENVEHSGAIPYTEQQKTGPLAGFGNFSSIQFPQTEGVEVRNFRMKYH